MPSADSDSTLLGITDFMYSDTPAVIYVDHDCLIFKQ